ncbi:MAG: class I SAM-dependent methyltransferase [Pseudomonadota bacterium]
MNVPAGASFRSKEVVDYYRYRPPYPSKVHEEIISFSPATGCLVDLGCGEGKVARPMAEYFDTVTAIDPSANMLQMGQSLPNGKADNIKWVEAFAEEAPLPHRIDVVTFASSVHWMNPSRLFPRLRENLRIEHILAVIQGDEPFEPPWYDEWMQFLAKWVPEMTGQPVNSSEWVGSRKRHLEYMDLVHSDDYFSEPMKQSVEDFVLCQNSRDTFSVERLGSRLSGFREELTALLLPHVDASGQLEFKVKTHLTIGKLLPRLA